MAKSVVDGIDALNDLGDATGASIENISALEDVAARTGTSMDTVSTALIKFNGVLKEAKPGSGTELALKAIGLNAKELRELDPAEALLQTATALSLFADDGNKARITQELFGKSLKEVAPFLKDLADKGKLVATVTAEQAREAEKFNKELFQLQKSMADSSREMAGPMVSAINAMIEKFRLGAIAGKSFYRTIVDEQLRLLGFNDGPKEYAARIEEISKKLESGNLHVNQRNALLREQAALQAKLNNTPNFSPDNQSAAEDARLGRKQSIGDIPDKPKKESSGKSQAQKDQEEFEKERLRIARKISMEEGDAINARNVAYQKSLEDQAAAHDKYLEGLMREEVAQSNNNRQLREAVEEIGLTTEQVDALHLARMDSNIALEEQNQLTREELGVSADVLNFYQRRLEMMREQRELTAAGQIAKADVESKAEKDKASKEYAKGVHDDLKGALSAAFRDSKDPLGAFGDALANVIYTRAATSLAEAMSGAASSAGGGVLDAVASFFSFANGGVMSSKGQIPMNAYATGGVATGPQLALFGEGRMNEAFVPLPDGKRIPVSLSGGEGGITVNQPIVINAPNASAGVADQIRAMVPAMLVENKRIIEGVIQQAMARRGGRLAA